MDKKNTIIGVLLLAAAMFFMYDSSKKEAAAEKYARQARAEQTAKAAATQIAPKSDNPTALKSADKTPAAPENFF